MRANEITLENRSQPLPAQCSTGVAQLEDTDLTPSVDESWEELEQDSVSSSWLVACRRSNESVWDPSSRSTSSSSTMVGQPASLSMVSGERRDRLLPLDELRVVREDVSSDVYWTPGDVAIPGVADDVMKRCIDM